MVNVLVFLIILCYVILMLIWFAYFGHKNTKKKFRGSVQNSLIDQFHLLKGMQWVLKVKDVNVTDFQASKVAALKLLEWEHHMEKQFHHSFSVNHSRLANPASLWQRPKISIRAYPKNSDFTSAGE